MTETHIVVCVFADGNSRIAATANLDTSFRQWRHRHGDFLPVIAFEAEPAAFRKLLSIRKLPTTVPTSWVAERLSLAPVELAAQPAVLKHIRWLGVKAPALLALWASAVQEVTA